ncbi:MAG: D-3-phosphoglycerate dehydrogenase / 2-oxoglutarate reductase [Acidobacteriota bacterium]|nr:D-3-phosphoglycerate dehydrogenase / 2-oxoglutarate reductase [Acidobacteriota bacterium]
MRIVIPDDYQDSVRHLTCFSKLAGHDVTIFNDTVKELDALAERFRDADALVLIRERTAITDELLARLPRLRMISQTGKGTAHIDLDACERRGVKVLVGTGSPYAPAELSWALILAAMRRIPQEAARLRSGGWQGDLGTTLRGRTLGIFGYGKIGTLVAGFGKAFGMNVVVAGREGSRSRAIADGHTVANDIFQEADVLSLHLRLTGETRGIVTRSDLGRMKPDALLVNTSRAELIEPGVLEAALRAGRPGLAAVDVYEEEPVVNASHPLLSLPNAVCTPHLGYVERDSYELYFGQAFDNILALQ